MTTEAFAPAKINLTLHVTGQRADGYHLLDSLVAFADVGDRLAFTPGPELSLSVTGPFAAGVPEDARNLVWQAALMVGFSGHIKLEKHLPHGAGIGGGSSDAAAVLRSFDAPAQAVSLGADVPVCLRAKAQRMRGIGEDLTTLPDFPRLWAVLANPGVTVPTPKVFAALQTKANPPMPDTLPPRLSARAMIDWLRAMRNDLEAPAMAIQPAIGTVLVELSRLPGAALCRMSGSGATCFALFEDQGLSEIAARDLARAHPDWWVRDCALS